MYDEAISEKPIYFIANFSSPIHPQPIPAQKSINFKLLFFVFAITKTEVFLINNFIFNFLYQLY